MKIVKLHYSHDAQHNLKVVRAKLDKDTKSNLAALRGGVLPVLIYEQLKYWEKKALEPQLPDRK